MNYTPDWLQNLIANYDTKVNAFYQNFAGVKNVNVPTYFLNEQKRLINRGSLIADKINNAKQSIITAKVWLNGLKGMFGLNGDNGLGFLPLLVPAVIVAGIVGLTALGITITAYIADTAKFSAKLNTDAKIANNLKDKPEAYRLYLNNQSDTQDKSTSANISDMFKYLAIAGGLFVAFQLIGKGK